MAGHRARAGSANTIVAYRRDLTAYTRVAARRTALDLDARRHGDARSTSSPSGGRAARRRPSVARQLAAIRMLHRFLVTEGERRRRPDRRARGRAGAGRAPQAADARPR